MERREALKHTAAILGVSIIGGEAFLSGCKTEKGIKTILTSTDIRLLDEIGETILPESDRSAGAKATHIGEFMKTMISDCYSEEEQEKFVRGIETIDNLSIKKYKASFLTLPANQQHELLLELDNQARKSVHEGNVHYFSMMKQLTILGYFTSEIGVTQALRYNPIPGGYDGCAEYKSGDKAWQGPLSSLG